MTNFANVPISVHISTAMTNVVCLSTFSRSINHSPRPETLLPTVSNSSHSCGPIQSSICHLQTIIKMFSNNLMTFFFMKNKKKKTNENPTSIIMEASCDFYMKCRWGWNWSWNWSYTMMLIMVAWWHHPARRSMNSFLVTAHSDADAQQKYPCSRVM